MAILSVCNALSDTETLYESSPTLSMAISAVSAALSKFNDKICEVNGAEELVIELTWMQCFLIDCERTPEGRVRAEFWLPAIQRLALDAQNLQSSFDGRIIFVGIKDLTKKLATLREKLHPFVTAHASSSSEVPPPPPPAKLCKEIKVAAWGCPGGQKWDHKGTLKQIVIVHGDIIDSITLTSLSPDGNAAVPTKFGGGGGYKTVQVDIDAPKEWLRGISGTYGVFDGSIVIKSLKIYTNRTQHGPIGSSCKNGDSFSCILEDGNIVGLHGSCGIYLNSIGVYTAPK